MPIKNIIFDLGGVIFDIDYHLTSQAFQKLGVANFDEIFSQHKQASLFDDFEVGKISAATFRDSLKRQFNVSMTDEAFDQAWNAMLISIPKARLDYVKSLHANYRVFLFSNTNAIHLQQVYNVCQRENGFNSLSNYFEKEYYSHLFGMRKPAPESFLAILNENQLNAEESLFVDDSIQHVLGAQQAGLQALHLTKDKSIFDVR